MSQADRDGEDSDDDVFSADGLFGTQPFDSEALAVALSAEGTGDRTGDESALMPAECRSALQANLRSVGRRAVRELSVGSFREAHLLPRIPVVLEGEPARREITAPLTTASLRARHGDVKVALDNGGEDEVRGVRLGDFLDALGPGEVAAGPRVDLRRRYLRNVHVATVFPEEAARLQLPSALGVNVLCNPARTPGIPLNWRHWYELFIGGVASDGFPFLHQDSCHVHALSMQVEGRKRFLLLCPGAREMLYVPGLSSRSRVSLGALIARVKEQEGRDMTAADLGALDEFPRLREATVLSVEIGAGEMLFIPSDWWHTALHGGAFERLCGDGGGGDWEEPSVTLQASFVDDTLEDAFCGAWSDMQAVRALAKDRAGRIVS